jgi:hypothetical protein
MCYGWVERWFGIIYFSCHGAGRYGDTWEYKRKSLVVSKELCYGKTVVLDNAEGAARWWRYNLVR